MIVIVAIIQERITRVGTRVTPRMGGVDVMRLGE